MSPSAIRARLEAATPGPWRGDGPTLRPGTIYDAGDNAIARAWEQADAAFIAAAPSDIERLLAMVDDLRGALLRLHGMCPPHGPDDAPCFVLEALARLDSEGSPL